MENMITAYAVCGAAALTLILRQLTSQHNIFI
jgi:hypothetical protein